MVWMALNSQQATTWRRMVETLVWYPCNVLILTLFWMTRAVIGIRGRTNMCRMNSFWPLWVCEFCHLELKVWAAAGTWEWLGWSCTSQPSTLCSTSPEEKTPLNLSAFDTSEEFAQIGQILVTDWWEVGVREVVGRTHRVGTAPHPFFAFSINALRLVEVIMMDYFWNWDMAHQLKHSCKYVLHHHST